MADEAILDLTRPDAIAGRGDDVVVAADEMEIAVVVDAALVAGGHPVADELLPRRVGGAPDATRRAARTGRPPGCTRPGRRPRRWPASAPTCPVAASQRRGPRRPSRRCAAAPRHA